MGSSQNNGITTVGAVRVTQSVAAVHSAVRRTILGLGLVGLVVLALGLTAGAFIAGQIARPLRRLERVARQMGARYAMFVLPRYQQYDPRESPRDPERRVFPDDAPGRFPRRR